MLVTGGASADDLMGPVGVGSMMSEVIDEAQAQGGMVDVILNIINFCILLSANLGIMNLLPIPALDGGRILFLLVEAITRRAIPKDKEAIVNGIGFVLLMLLMIFVFFNDISNVFFK
jgi:regulator of sigma E protease